MREILTLQLGVFANFLGSHFWNFQDELQGLRGESDDDPVFRNHHLDMDVLYRTGQTQQGSVSYTPRLVSVDLQGSLGSMSSRGTLYNDRSFEHEVLTWNGNVSTQSSEPCNKNLFLQRLYEEEQDASTTTDGVNGGTSILKKEIDDKDIIESLENVVQYWTDFAKVHYHPRSLYQMTGCWMEGQGFDNYGIGKEAFSGDLKGEVDERIRLFVEECDHIQGFQFVVDDSGGFSAVAADLLEMIADDYRNIPVMLYSVRGHNSHVDPTSSKQTVSRDLHDAVSFSKLSSFCKMIVPVGLPSLSTSKAARFLTVKDENPYHCSAVYAAALHTITLPLLMDPLQPTTDTRETSGPVDVNGLVQMLTAQGRENMVAVLDIAMPSPSLAGTQFNQTLLGNLHSLTPEISNDVEDVHSVEFLSSLGSFRSGVSRATVTEVNSAVEAAYRASVSRRPMFCHLSAAQCPVPIPLPFPSIFGASVGQHGQHLSSPTPGSSSRKSSLDVHSVPVSARLRSSRAVLPYLEKRLGRLRRYGIERGGLGGAHLMRTWGFGPEELEEMSESLSKMVACLKPESAISSDSE